MRPSLSDKPPGMPPAGSTNYLSNQAAQLNVDSPRPSAGSGSAAPTSGPVVYVGETKELPTNPATGSPYWYGQPIESRQYVSPDVLMVQFDGWNAKRKRQIARRLAKGGFIPVDLRMDETLDEYLDRLSIGDIRSGYENLLMQAVQAAEVDPNTKLSPMRILDKAVDYNRGVLFTDAGTAPSGRSTTPSGGSTIDAGPTIKELRGGKTFTTTQKRIDIYRKEDAEALIRQVLSNELGRVPTEDEYADFVDALNAESRDNPSVVKTSQTYSKSGRRVVETENKVKAGLSRSAVNNFATEWAEEQPGAAEWQAIGTYFPALLGALGAVVPGA